MQRLKFIIAVITSRLRSKQGILIGYVCTNCMLGIHISCGTSECDVYQPPAIERWFIMYSVVSVCVPVCL